MLKNIFITLFCIGIHYSYSQENKITVAPLSMMATSTISITAKEKGNYIFSINKKNSKKTLFSKSLFIEKRTGFKHNFASYQKGIYIFSLKRNNKEVYKTTKIKQ